MDSNDATVSRHTTNRLIQAIGFDATRYRAVIGVQSADDTPFSVVAPQNVRGAAKEWRVEIPEQKFATEVDDFLALQGRSLPATLDGQTLRKLVHDLTSKLSSEDEADLDIVRAFGDSGQADSAESAQALASADSMIARWSSRNASEPTADLDDKLEHVQLLAHLQALRSNIQAIRDPTEFDWDSMTPLSQRAVLKCATRSVGESLSWIWKDSKRLVQGLMGTAPSGTTPSAGVTDPNSSASQTQHKDKED